MKKRFKAFTLVEMLIVMGIIIILMALGIASGRFAIRRANRIEHQNAAENIYQAMQAYYSDNREYPCKDDVCTPMELMSPTATDPVLSEYVDDFEGGTEATYMYMTSPLGSAQEALICVTYGGAGDVNQLGIFCTGNAIGMTDAAFGDAVPGIKDMDYGEPDYNTAADLFEITNSSVWDPAIEGNDKWSIAVEADIPVPAVE
jgi:type II secretory pathway pseudopilin PulG